MIVLFICWFGSFVFEGDGVEDVWGGRVGRGEGAGVWVLGGSPETYVFVV